MEEQFVRQNEQKERAEAGTAPVNVPAPMVERAFRLLDLLSATEEGLTLSELARALHASKGSVHGLLRTLESIGAIEPGESRRFVLGSRIYDLAQSYQDRVGDSARLRRLALPAMHRLATSSGETVCLGRIEQKGVRIIEYVVDDEKALHIAAPRGLRVPLLAAATGACVLASWPVEERSAFLHASPLPHFTARSLTDPQRYLERVEEVSRTGIGFDYEEYLDGVNAVCVPIYGPGRVLAALLWIVGFASRWKDAALQLTAQQLQTEAAAIAQAFVQSARNGWEKQGR
jgi:DNA-binding IclR family transcriptional regulator